MRERRNGHSLQRPLCPDGWIRRTFLTRLFCVGSDLQLMRGFGRSTYFQGARWH